MRNRPILQPTLWRTCRVLANRTRLRLFYLLLQEPDQTVSRLAQQLNLPLPVASQYLRAMEARGLLAAHRVKRRVEYRLGPASDLPAPKRLVAALRKEFQRGPEAMDSIFGLATAFTHPRRIELFRLLTRQSQTLGQLKATTGISVAALQRHLWKLERRGFVCDRLGQCRVVRQANPLARALALLAR